MREADYYRLKCGLLEAALLQEQARSLRDRAFEIQSRALIAAGLDPRQTYELDDQRRRAIAQPGPPTAPPAPPG